MPSLLETKADGYHFYPHLGQWRALQSAKRFVLVLAGTQSGKTSMGPVWLLRETQQQGAGDYLVVTPTYPLLNLKALPEFRRLFESTLRLGIYKAAERTFTFHDGKTTVFFGHASDPDSLESATAKAVWLDECGQKKFRLGSWEAIQRRLSIHQGRALLTTTPYDLGWLKQQLWDPWHQGKGNHPDIDVINFASTMNPAFPRSEYERARASLPAWKFDLFYRGIFSRPAGLIYDSFDAERHVVPRFAVPEKWPRYLGLDFGGVNTAGLYFAEEPGTNRLYAYREYKAGGQTAKGHAAALLQGEPGIPFAVGGSGSEDQWRAEFAAAGLPVREPAVTGPDSVEVGIDRVYGAFKRGELYVFADLARFLDELGSYSRELDDAGEPTEKIEDKDTYHVLDACRYIIGWVKRPNAGAWSMGHDDKSRSVLEDAPPGVFLS